MSDPSENVDQPMITREETARAIVNYFLANAEVGNHAANDELIAELARRQREHRASAKTQRQCLNTVPSSTRELATD